LIAQAGYFGRLFKQIYPKNFYRAWAGFK
jgi:hypothetical protein